MLSVEQAEGYTVVTLDRPEKRNALSIELRLELSDALERIAADDGVGCAVLTGAGSAFSSGMDTTQFGGDRGNRLPPVASTGRIFCTAPRLPYAPPAGVLREALAWSTPPSPPRAITTPTPQSPA